MKVKTNRLVSGFLFEKETAIYKTLGVNKFKKIVPFGDYWIRLFNKLFSKDVRLLKSKENATVWVAFTLAVEFLHFAAFLIAIGFAISYVINEEYFRLLKNSIFNLTINVYPIMVQRYNRIRIMKIFKINMEDLEQFELK